MAQVVPNDLHQDPLVSSSSQTSLNPFRRTHPVSSPPHVPTFPNSNSISSSHLSSPRHCPPNSQQPVPGFQSRPNRLVQPSAMPSSDPTANDPPRTVDRTGSAQPNSNGPISSSDDPTSMLNPQSLQSHSHPHPHVHPHSRSHPMANAPFSSSDRPDPTTAATAGMSSASLSATASQTPNDSSGDPNGAINSINPSYHSAVNAPRSSGPPVMGMMNSFADMALGNPIPYATPMPLLPMQPHVMPLVPPQHVQQMSHRQAPPPALVPNQRTTACHWVPQDRVGAVIGGHGTVIRTLQEKSGATIQVHNETVRGDLKLFTIYGFPSQIDSAIQLIEDIVGRTRPALTSPPDRAPSFLSHSQRSNDMFKTIFVPTSCVGLVIGRNGDTIRNLQDRSGADIKVTPDQQVQPGQPSRSIVLTGSEDSISMAQRLITDIVVDSSRRNPHPAPVVGTHINGELVVMAVLHVQNEKVGLIIGRKGVAIREFQLRSGAKIQVTKDGNSVQADGSRPVMVTGTRVQIEEARKLIASKINVQYLPSHEVSSNAGSGGGMSPMASQSPSGVSAGVGVNVGGTGGSGSSSTGNTGVSSALGEGVGTGSGSTVTPNMQFGFGGTGYDQEYSSGQQAFQTMFDGHDAVAHGRPPVPYVQYIGFNNYPAGMSPHGRPMSHNVPMPYGAAPQQQQPQQSAHQPQPHAAKLSQHSDGVDGVNVSGSNAADTLQDTYGIEGHGNGKLMFGAYDGSAVFGSGRDQHVMFGREDGIDGAVSSRDGVHPKPSGTGQRDSTSASNDNVVTATTSKDNGTTNASESSRIQKMQDGESVTVSAGRKRNEDVSNG